ncbi:MAG TPA: dihydroorotate dehydrogenase-like protein [Streptosporangiaceae bacterium]|nr:dihydroorotate dehydrogenase-like protein [Streptosporangiaceae bacterium]HUL25999.1 dihydroorotate dehydrogenase-like protein [Streptosporangiaceae bacterium]
MDLTTNYLGLTLKNPLVASAGPIARTVQGVQHLADAGVGAIVLPSLFEEQVQREAERDAELAETGAESFAESLSYLPGTGEAAGPRRYLDLLSRAAGTVDVPVIASLNGVTAGGWTDYAAAMQEAGAAAIELNVYYLPADPRMPGRDVEQRYVDILTTVKAAVTIPVAVKLGPFFSSAGEMAIRLDRAGADGLVLFNRFMQTDIDPETLTVSSGLTLSSPAEAALPRSWIARLRGLVGASLAASTGVETAADVAAYLLAGADVVMTTSSLLRHGPAHAAVLVDELGEWLKRKGFATVDDARGLLAVPAGDHGSAFERAGYLTAIKEASRAYGPPVGGR